MWWLKQRIHSSWLIAWFCVAVVIGIAGARYVSPLLLSSAWLILAIGLAGYGLFVRRRYAVIAVIAAGLLLGVWRASLDLHQLTVYQDLIGHQLQIRGQILEDVDIDSSGQTIIRLGDLSIDGRDLAGKIWLTVDNLQTVKRSDYLVVRGQLNEGFGTFLAAMYRAELISYHPVVAGDMARDLRDRFSDKVQEYIDEPAVSLGLGYLTGQRRGLPPELLETLRVAGLTHVIVASGYNLTILVRLARRLFEKQSKYLATAVPAGLVIGFIAVTGMSPSMSRAGLVTGLSLLAWYYGRRFHPLVLLSIVAATTTLVNPSYAWGDIGWLLSFAAFAGVMILAPLLQVYFFGTKPPGTLRQILGETMSAHIFTLPIIAVSFGEFSNVALMANLMVLPLIPIVMLGVFLTGILSLVAGWLALVVAWPTELVLSYMIETAEWWASQSWATSQVEVDWWAAVAAYGGLVLICVYLRFVTKFSLLSSSIVD